MLVVDYISLQYLIASQEEANTSLNNCFPMDVFSQYDV